MNETASSRPEKETWNPDVNKHENNLNEDRPPDDLNDEFEKLNENDSTKNIILYRNGDKYFPPKRFVVNKRYIRTWDSFLEELTKAIQPRSGAIRDIRTPYHGTRIKSMEDLTVNGKYVAVAKGEMLKLIDYTNVIDVGKPLPKNEREARFNKKAYVKATNHEMDKIENRINQQLHTKGFYIYVYRNGDPFTRGIKIVLNQFEQRHMSTLVRAIEERVLLQSNRPIRRLYTMDGEIIRYAKDVEHGQYYVAAANEPLYNIKYGQYLPVIRGGKVPSGSNRVKYLNKSPTPVTSRHVPENNETNEDTYRTQRGLYTDRGKPRSRSRDNEQGETKDDDKNKAAFKIQNAYRKHSARKRNQTNDENNEPNLKNRNNFEPKNPRKPQDDEKNNGERVNRDRNQQEPYRSRRQPEDNNRNNKPYVDTTNERKQNPPNRKENNDQEKERKNVSEKKYEKAPRGHYTSRKKENPRNPAKKNHSGEEEMAAQTIQAAFRGYMFRKRGNSVSKKPAEKRREPVQKKEPVQRKELEQRKEPVQRKEPEKKKEPVQKKGKKEEENENDDERKRAAITIQAGFKGFRTRESLRKSEENRQREKAATTIQYGYRGYKTRKEMDDKDEERRREEAATIIQFGYRGYKTRKQVKEKEENVRREKAALTIQSSYRGFKTRKEVQKREASLSREKAALAIQAGYRGYVTRKTIDSDLNARFQEQTAEEQARDRNNAAATIQASFRGYKRRLDSVQR